MKVKRSKINQSLEKTIQLVETMARGQGSMRLQDIANQCGMPPARPCGCSTPCWFTDMFSRIR